MTELVSTPRHRTPHGVRLGGGEAVDSAVARRPSRARAPAPASPLNFPLGPARRMAMLRADLDDAHLVRKTHGGTVNEVLLTMVTGGLRCWLADRRHSLAQLHAIRHAMAVNKRAGPGHRPGAFPLLAGPPAAPHASGLFNTVQYLIGALRSADDRLSWGPDSVRHASFRPRPFGGRSRRSRCRGSGPVPGR